MAAASLAKQVLSLTQEVALLKAEVWHWKMVVVAVLAMVMVGVFAREVYAENEKSKTQVD